MREILFRGKMLEYPRDWVEGMHTIRKFAGKEYQAIERRERRIITYDYEWAIQPYEVLSETIGQYIGLTDKNGKKIFEGDIVKTKTGRLCEIYWFVSPNMSGWDLKPVECNNPPPSEYDLFLPQNLEVVGNIHDNPELKEVSYK